MNDEGQVQAAFSSNCEFVGDKGEKAEKENKSVGYPLEKVDIGYPEDFESAKEFWIDFKDQNNLTAREKERVDQIANKMYGGIRCFSDACFKLNGSNDNFQASLYFQEQNVLLFTLDYKDDYEIALQSDGKCYCLDNDEFDVDRFVREIMK